MKEDDKKVIKEEDWLFRVLISLSLEDYHFDHYYVYGKDFLSGAIITAEEFEAIDSGGVDKWLKITHAIIGMSKFRRSNKKWL